MQEGYHVVLKMNLADACYFYPDRYSRSLVAHSRQRHRNIFEALEQMFFRRNR